MLLNHYLFRTTTNILRVPEQHLQEHTLTPEVSLSFSSDNAAGEGQPGELHAVLYALGHLKGQAPRLTG